MSFSWEGCALPNPPARGLCLGYLYQVPEAHPKPSRGRAMFTSELDTPRAFVYSFPIRWPISPRVPGSLSRSR